jgi:hypothetical protein
MGLELTVCAAAEVLELVKVREGQNTPFGLVLSIESPADPVQDRASRLASAIGPQWADRQVFSVLQRRRNRRWRATARNC